jgi:large subunit ribosomal protein L23
MSLYTIIKRPVVTEKSQKLELEGVYTVMVTSESTKVDVRTAFERLYGVHVEKVNMITTREKFRNSKHGVQVKRKSRLKAMVTLKK